MLILSIKENEKVYIIKGGKRLGYMYYRRHKRQRQAIFVHSVKDANQAKPFAVDKRIVAALNNFVEVPQFDIKLLPIRFISSHSMKLGFEADQSIRIIRQVLYEKA